MLKIPATLHQELQHVLLNCGPFNSNESLRAHFAVAPLIAWQSQLPQTRTEQERVQATIELLARHETAEGESALAIFLQYLSDSINELDSCHGELAALADKVSQLPQVAAPTLREKVTNFIWGDSKAEQNRQAMLDLVEDIWVKGLLENSLQEAVLLTLGLENRPSAVINGRQMVLQVALQSPQTLPPDTPILTVFQQQHQALLILGEPGAGKTTTLLELARATIALARHDPSYPIPVVFNLSTWRKEPLADWLAEAFFSFYQIPRKIARTWLEHDQLLLLLDGLDEVEVSQRAACVEAINQFRAEHLVPMAVCSRLADYEALGCQLKLQGAVRLQALSPAQIEHYLTATDSQTVRMAIAQDSDLQELAQSPLMLSLMSVAYRDVSPDALPALSSPTARHRHLFDNYVQQMFTRRLAAPRYTPEQTRAWLSQLAQNMSHHAQSLFLLEQLQPSWLPTRGGYWLYLLVTHLVPIWLFGAVLGLGFGVFSFSQGLEPPLFMASIILTGLVGIIGTVVNIMDGLWHDYFVRYPHLQAKAINWWYTLLNIWGGVVLISSTSEIIVDYLGNGLSYYDRSAGEMVIRLVIYLINLLALFLGLQQRLQQLDMDIRPVEGVRWSWRNFGQPFFSGIAVAGLLERLDGVGIWEVGMAAWSILLSLIIGLIFSLVLGWQSYIMATKTKPNQGIWLSLKNGFLLGAFNGVMGLGLVLIIVAMVDIRFGMGPVYRYWLPVMFYVRLNSYLLLRFIQQLLFMSFLIVAESFREWLITFVLVTISGVFWFGGVTAWKHFCLRVLLWWWGVAPWRYVEFLDFAAERILLRKVGGGYIFVHRLLLEYFASLPRREEGTD